MGQQITIAYLKTLLGGWITARRTQSTPKNCIFCNQHAGDELQHLIDCDVLWYAIYSVFPPFTADFDPLSLLGLLPPSPYQIYGVYLAFHIYHSLRNSSLTSLQEIIRTAKAYTKSCSVHDHLIKSFYGKTQLKYTFSPSLPTSLTALGSSSSNQNQIPSSSAESATSFTSHLTPEQRAQYRARMPPNRRAVFRARGFSIAAATGPDVVPKTDPTTFGQVLVPGLSVGSTPL